MGPGSSPASVGGTGTEKGAAASRGALRKRGQPPCKHRRRTLQSQCVAAGGKGGKGVSPSKDARWKALIVDDEELARHVIREFLQSHVEIEVAAECANGMEAVKAVAEHKPNLIFLDVQMPKLTGFDVLELIGTDVSVIFVTAYDQYAMRAFEVHAVDYLLKPIGRDRFEPALERAKNRTGEKMPPSHELPTTPRTPHHL